MATIRNIEKVRKLGGPLAWQQSSMPNFTERYMRTILADDPVLYWPGQDTSGHILDCSPEKIGRIPFRDSVTEASLTYRRPGPFKGLSYAITKGGSSGECRRPSMSFTTNNLTMEGWVNLTSSLGSNRALFDCGGSLVGNAVIMTSATHYAVVIQGVAIAANNTTVLTTGVWYHIVVTKDAGTWKYYLNGAGDNVSAGTQNPQPNTGKMGLGGADVQVFDWAHFAYYETALSSTQALAHYNAGKA